MHVIRAKQDPSKLRKFSCLSSLHTSNTLPVSVDIETGASFAQKPIASGSGLSQMAVKTTSAPASKSASTQQRSVPPSTRQFAKDYANFHGETQISD